MRPVLLSLSCSLATTVFGACVPPPADSVMIVDDRSEVPPPEPEVRRPVEYRLHASYADCTNSEFCEIPDKRKGYRRHNQEPFYANVAYRKRKRR